MPRSTSDFAIAGTLARARWGETGFRCDDCGHDAAYRCARRPRTFQCKRCRRQQSVTAGTAMHGTKLPLEVWIARAAWHDARELPTSRRFALEHEIAPSSAWHLNQRFMAAVDAGHVPHLDEAGFLPVGLKWRRPKPGPAVSELAPTPLRATIERFRSKVQKAPLQAPVVLGFWAREARMSDVAPSREKMAQVDGNRAHLAAMAHRGVSNYLAHALEHNLRTVCVRWAGAYVRYLLALWNAGRTGSEHPVPWGRALALSPHRRLPELRDLATDFRVPKTVPKPPRPAVSGTRGARRPAVRE